MRRFKSLRLALLGAAGLAGLLGFSPRPAEAAMQLGGNFWFSYRNSDATDPFISNADFASYPNNANPWRQVAIDDSKAYSGPLRFMDWGCTNNQTVVNWSDRKQPTAPDQEGAWNGNKEYAWSSSAGWTKISNPGQAARGIAYEWMIDLCNRTGRDMWVCVPHKANDTYVRELARLIKSKLNSGLKVYVEYSNEVWNPGFDQQHWCEDQGKAQPGWSGSNYDKSIEYYGYRSGQIFKIWAEEWSGSMSRVVRVLSGQSVEHTSFADKTVAGMNRISGVAADAWAIAPYFGSSITSSTSDPIGAMYSDIDTRVARSAQHDQWATTKGYKFLAYEGGQHVYQSGADVVNRRSEMYDVYITHFNKMDDYFDVFVHYAHTSTYNGTTAWGAKEGWTQSDSSAHKWRAMKKWIADNGGTTPPPPPSSPPPPPPPPSSPPPPPPPSTTAAADIAAGTATIDGGVDSSWSNATSYNLSNTNSGTVSSTSDLSASFKSMWDSSNLYVLVDVTDDSKRNDSINAWDDDSVEIYLDGNNDKASSYDANDRQVVVGYGDTSATEGGGRDISGVTFSKADPSSTSYRMEVKVPWSVLGVSSPAAAKKIGLDVHVNDDDDGSGRDGKRAWATTGDNSWSNPTTFGTGTLKSGSTPPPPPPPPSSGTGTGLRGEYFNNTALTAPSVLVRTDPTVNFSWSASPGTGVNADNFSVRWTGQVEAPTTGTYTFQTVSDDGVRVWLTTASEAQVINNWTNHAPTTNTSSGVSLTGGTKYSITLEFYDATGGAEARLRWITPGTTSAVTIPQDRLYAAGGTTPPPPPPPPPPTSTTVTLNPSDDKSSQEDTGTGATPPVSQWSTFHLKFNVSSISGTIGSAKLRVYRNETSQGSISFRAHQQTNDSWTESTAGSSLPAKGTQIGSGVSSSAVGYVEFDVTDYVKGQASGDDMASLVVDTNSGGWTRVNAGESSSNKPQLVVTSN